MMSEPSSSQDRALQALSALTDGECETGQFAAACDAWRSDAGLRQSWHAYALIGDVMRSDDLAVSAGHDQAFLQRLRVRLADEPVVLAPVAVAAAPVVTSVQQPLRVGGARAFYRRRWAAPAAVAAGLVVVTGAMVVMRTTVPADGGGQMLAGGPRGAVRAVAVPAVSVPDLEADMVRNPDLDRYLNAHRQFTQGPALAAPGGVRQVAVTPGGR